MNQQSSEELLHEKTTSGTSNGPEKVRRSSWTAGDSCDVLRSFRQMSRRSSLIGSSTGSLELGVICELSNAEPEIDDNNSRGDDQSDDDEVGNIIKENVTNDTEEAISSDPGYCLRRRRGTIGCDADIKILFQNYKGL